MVRILRFSYLHVNKNGPTGQLPKWGIIWTQMFGSGGSRNYSDTFFDSLDPVYVMES